ncbi:putative Cinnamate beta-D-glucosyltransferase [Hypsibius exemplaris]|uniref:Cinnamate beta-D-glucosyltransferase n=1 Tax=Hypsibius exemplaris TaxID=2072580 RepID=A0A9X6NCF8_HYPEX|nr:putative Cinnamate beta-D-glucosyltransferase [Hypsibius exemplaris]
MLVQVYESSAKAVEQLLGAIPTRKSPEEPEQSLGIQRAVNVVIGDNFLALPIAVCHRREIPFYFFNTMAATLTLGALCYDDKIPVLEEDEKSSPFLKGENSVVYISFGSILFPAPEQIAELAKALLELKKPFIWSLPSQHHRHLPQEIGLAIPRQFESTGLAPQKLILQHPATAVFLSHCGWNSTLESLAAGQPVVAWPMFSDQMLNAQLLQQRSTAVLIEGTGTERLVAAEEIAEALRNAGYDKCSFREAAESWRATFLRATSAGGSSEIALKKLISA